jgi:hypothetical protein
MAKTRLKAKPTLPAGLVPYKGTRREIEKLNKWLLNEPDNLASGGRNLRHRHTVKK